MPRVSHGKIAPNAVVFHGVRARRPMQPIRAVAEPDKLVDEATGIKKMREGVKESSEETILTPRFYTTDFEEMERLWGPENTKLDDEEIRAILREFQRDFNQRHFIRNERFRKAADQITGDKRKIFIEFLERSCTAEFSGFLLYKELGRRLRKINPEVAECFTLMSRDEARHAGFLNKAMSDFNLALDLGFMTKNRQYTFFQPKFILYATYLSEKIGYWRYITIYRSLQNNPEYQFYPIFEWFENWCQDENRHGDFLSALLKSQPDLLNDWQAKLWARFFCLSVYITMYLNDHQRSAFYEALGLDTTEFNMHVLHETNKTTATVFPQVIDTYNPEFKERLDRMVVMNKEIAKIAKSDMPDFMKKLQQAPHAVGILKETVGLFLMPPIDAGSYDITPPAESALEY